MSRGTTQIVLNLLDVDPDDKQYQDKIQLRDNDLRLMLNVWMKELQMQKPSFSRLTMEEVKTFLLSGKLSSPESIRRSRQKLQEHIPRLRGDLYWERQEKAKAMKDELRKMIEVEA